MPKLLIVSRASNPHGGADQIIADLCRNLPKLDWQVTLALTRGAKFNSPERYREVHPGLPIIEIDGRLGLQKERVRKLRKVIDEQRPDVVLVMRVFEALHACATSICSPRLVMGIRSYEPGYLSDARRYRKAIDYIITSGKLIAKACTDWAGIDPRRVTSIAGGVHPAKTIHTQKLIQSPVRILYAGRVDNEQKRCLDFVGVLDELYNKDLSFRFEVAGTGPALEQLQSEFQQKPYARQVTFHGWVDRDQLYRELYPKADIFLHCAAWEGVTIAPREAMAHGVVPVISQFDGLGVEGQFIDGENALTFPIGDVVAAANRIKQLVDAPKLFTKYSQSATQSQAGEYSFDGAIAKWNDALRSSVMLPKLTGRVELPNEILPGRLSQWGIPLNLQSLARKLLNRSVVHQSPGSEWPTGSGLLSKDERDAIKQFAHDNR